MRRMLLNMTLYLQLDNLNKSMNEMQNLNSALQDEASQLSKHDSELQTQLTEAQKRIERWVCSFGLKLFLVAELEKQTFVNLNSK